LQDSKKDFKTTVRLPKTNFEMKANLANKEPEILNFWQELNIYDKIQEKNQVSHKNFTLHDGPPYANGNIHIGHALNRILKDIILKSLSNLGYQTPFVLGWDCHGLPIEWKIEEGYKKQGFKKDEISKEKFRKDCRDFAKKFVEIQQNEIKRLGVFASPLPYLTMDNESEALIYQEITKFVLNDTLYIGKKPVFWSTVEQTALAEAEVEYHQKVSQSIYIGFEITNNQDIIYKDTHILVWTTTPWTLPANQALAFSQSLNYTLYEVVSTESSLIAKNTKFIIAKDLIEDVKKNLNIQEIKQLKENIDLSQFQVKHTLFNAGYTVLRNLYPADFVNSDSGTGIVHIAPTHGEDDFYLGKKYNLDLTDFLNDDGTYNKQVKLFAGQHIFKAHIDILQTLKDSKTLFANQEITHSYPHSWRSKAPLIYRLTPQIFINLSKETHNIKNLALKAIENNISFYPKISKNRLKSMVENRPDWCVSRQRVWGVPIALFIHKETSTFLKDENIFKNIIDSFKKNSSDVWFNQDPYNFLPSNYNKEDYIAVQDVIDVWFESGCTHSFVLSNKSNPNYHNLKETADMYLEGSDQHRGWFQSSLIEALGSSDSNNNHAKLPFKKLLTHGFVLDGSGQKMSKSIGNVISPADIIKDYGADILRLWCINSNYQEDVKIAKDIMQQQLDIYKKIRNTFKYLLGNLSHAKDIDLSNFNEESLSPQDKYILHKIHSLDSLFQDTYEKTYQLHDFFITIYNFIYKDLSSFYFDLKKDILYCESAKSIKYISTIYILDVIYNFIIKWLSPILPFTTEESYQHYLTFFPLKSSSVFLHNFQQTKDSWLNNDLSLHFAIIKEIKESLNILLEKQRQNKTIGSSLEAEITLTTNNQAVYNILQSKDLKEIFIVSSLNILYNKDLKESNTDSKSSMGINLASFKDSIILINFNKYDANKCQRCWKLEQELNQDSLCIRCQKATN
jgi:isoleucyl-tRNA synthetase